VTSGDVTNLARCRYCGREFDVRRFQVRLVGRRGAYDSVECAYLDDAVEPAPVRQIQHYDARDRRKHA
jgi:hypothetical protein